MPAALLIPTDPAEPAQPVTYDGLTDLQELLGGTIEEVALPPDSRDMFTNESAKIVGLPANVRATALWRRDWQEAGPTDADRLARETINGPAVVVGGIDDDGATMDLSDEDRAHVLAVCGAATP